MQISGRRIPQHGGDTGADLPDQNPPLPRWGEIGRSLLAVWLMLTGLRGFLRFATTLDEGAAWPLIDNVTFGLGVVGFTLYGSAACWTRLRSRATDV